MYLIGLSPCDERGKYSNGGHNHNDEQSNHSCLIPSQLIPGAVGPPFLPEDLLVRRLGCGYICLFHLASPLVADSWIDQHVYNIYRQIYQDKCQRDYKNSALNQHIITVVNAPTISDPMPGQENTFSVRMAPAKQDAS